MLRANPPRRKTHLSLSLSLSLSLFVFAALILSLCPTSVLAANYIAPWTEAGDASNHLSDLTISGATSDNTNAGVLYWEYAATQTLTGYGAPWTENGDLQNVGASWAPTGVTDSNSSTGKLWFRASAGDPETAIYLYKTNTCSALVAHSNSVWPDGTTATFSADEGSGIAGTVSVTNGATTGCNSSSWIQGTATYDTSVTVSAYKDSAKTQLVAQGTASAFGSVTLTAQNGSGLSGSVTAASAGTDTDSGNTLTGTLEDLTAPTPVSIVASATSGGATITWETVESGSSRVEYGLTDAYGTSTAETDTSPRQTSHSVTLSALSSCTTYHYRVKSTDASTNEGVSSDQTFQTSGCSTGAGGSATYWRRLYEDGLASPDFVEWWEGTSGQTASSISQAPTPASSSSVSSASSSLNPYRLLRSSAETTLPPPSFGGTSSASSASLVPSHSASSGPSAVSFSRSQRICARVNKWIPPSSPRHSIILRRIKTWLGITCG